MNKKVCSANEKKGQRCTMAEVSYKNFLKSTKKVNNQKMISKYPSIQSTKKISGQNHNFKKENLRHTYVVQQKKLILQKRKRCL